ncbi:isoprenoid biosynthesis glyoxalase ElbB [Motiliproteus sp. SC1-56]|uniref:isoprenoid biosynthesis glyoxalase ElbB n=1 Tax=Motiliproteus sp. SC1-56 TaxID=2799565 RepID=UPI001A8DBFB1|nr:isoprenoid biosynthesis glyoxalase ElbB [Motiliproteus sp. SC1-56]
MKKVAVILAGCGVFDGSEIYETVMTLYQLEQQGACYQCMAPNVEQHHVIDHRSGEPMADERRNVLTESARLARGEIIDLAEAKPDEYDALIIPGGFGAAKNLSDFALKGAECRVNEQVLAFVQAIHQAGKPVGLVCIAPALAPRLFGEDVICTIGEDENVAEAITAMGGRHRPARVDEVVIDPERNLVTTPAYMLANSISEAAEGITCLVGEVLARA